MCCMVLRKWGSSVKRRQLQHLHYIPFVRLSRTLLLLTRCMTIWPLLLLKIELDVSPRVKRTITASSPCPDCFRHEKWHPIPPPLSSSPYSSLSAPLPPSRMRLALASRTEAGSECAVWSRGSGVRGVPVACPFPHYNSSFVSWSRTIPLLTYCTMIDPFTNENTACHVDTMPPSPSPYRFLPDNRTRSHPPPPLLQGHTAHS